MSKYDRIVPAVQAVIDEYGGMRLTLRQIYYRLVAGQVIENTLSQYKSLSEILVKARLEGDIGMADIEDRTRAMNFGHGEDMSPSAYFRGYWRTMESLARFYTMPRWSFQPKYVQVWVEKEALSRLFSEITLPEGVDLAVCRGYPSLTFLSEAADSLADHPQSEDWDNVHVLYFGDFDPSGKDIERYVAERLGDLGAFPQVRRVALTVEQIEEYNLPPAPAKTTDSRYNRFVAEEGVAWQVELDAIEPSTLQGMIRDAIRLHWNGDASERRTRVLQERRAQIQEWLDDYVDHDFEPPEEADDD